MDIRSFFKKRKIEVNSSSADNKQEAENNATSSEKLQSTDIDVHVDNDKKNEVPAGTSGNLTEKSSPEMSEISRSTAMQSMDIGIYVNSHTISFELKNDLLRNCWTPSENYDFKNDSICKKRIFRHAWLRQYKPWLAYSAHLRGAICKLCVLFPQKVKRGYKGAFITTAFVKYKDFHEAVQYHVNSQWHKFSTIEANNVMSITDGKQQAINLQVHSAAHNTIKENKEKIFSIVSTIVFCGTNDIPLRGKLSTTGNFQNLLNFRVEAGDDVLKAHLETCSKNAKYCSVRTQNDIINICGNIIRDDIVVAANSAVGFSILADETTDIAGVEQLSLGVRFPEHINGESIIREEFLGFVPIFNRSAEGIATEIIKACSNYNLDMENLVGQGYDGCSAMAGREGGVQAKIRAGYPKAMFVHCSSHRLNLVVHDLNELSEIRNVVGTIKAVINYFRESSIRRSTVPNIPMLCETRWTQKHKSIRIFADNFVRIVNQLQHFSQEGSAKSKQTAYQLYSACTHSKAIISLVVISKYSSILEPVSQALQAVELDLLKVYTHIQEIIAILKQHRENSESVFGDIISIAENIADEINVDLSMPRQATKQLHRPNHPCGSLNEYYRRSIFIPYIDSLISSLQSRFSEEHTETFNLFKLLPQQMKNLCKKEFEEVVTNIQKYHNIDNFLYEANVWYDFWSLKTQMPTNLPITSIIDKHTEFFPAIKKALLVALALPVTTCTIERSFSTLRRVKTWLRSTMSENRLCGLCMLSVHRKKVMEKSDFINSVINKFGQQPRRLLLAFKEDSE